MAGHEPDVPLAERFQDRLRYLLRDRDGRIHVTRDAHVDLFADAPLHQVVVQQQRTLERRRRTLVRLAEHGDQHLSAGERRKRVPQSLGPRNGVVLVSVLDEARRGGHVVVGTETYDQEVGVVGTTVGHHMPRRWVDRGDALLAELDAGFGYVPIVQSHFIGKPRTEQDVELRESEDERVALVDQGYRCFVGRCRGQPSGQLESREPCPQDHDALLHVPKIRHRVVRA